MLEGHFDWNNDRRDSPTRHVQSHLIAQAAVAGRRQCSGIERQAIAVYHTFEWWGAFFDEWLRAHVTAKNSGHLQFVTVHWTFQRSWHAVRFL